MSKERVVSASSGWGILALTIATYIGAPVFFILGAIRLSHVDRGGLAFLFSGIGIFIVAIFLSSGFMTVQPNEARVLVLFGRYVGTIKENGFWWANPFFTKRRISLRSHNLNGEKLKVNDKAGNPIEIAAVIVWKVADTFAACFEVENYSDYVRTQSESALRHLASTYPYDSWEEEDDQSISLRANIDEVSNALVSELQDRLNRAGVRVEEARLSHLAYAPEIAGAMLQRQQASAIIAARQKIVEGAVGMVRMALEKLSQEKVVLLDDERKAAMVSNLLVVLCGEKDVHPVINAGSLY